MPETTVMRDSVVGDAWIKQACEANPVQEVYDAAGNPTGNWLTGPVRLVFCDSLFVAKPQMKTDPNSKLKHSTGILFTPFTNMQPLWDLYYKIAAAEFAEYWNPAMNQYVGLDNPITDQGFKAHKYGGYTPGQWTTNLSSEFAPPIVDIRHNPIVDHKAVYAGCWAIVCINAYASGKNFPRKGPRFGLVTVMKIGDDKPLSGGQVDPKAQFGRVQVVPPTAVPAGAFAASAGTNTPPTAGRPPSAAYYPPGGIPAAGHLPAPPRPAGNPPVLPPDPDEDISQFM